VLRRELLSTIKGRFCRNIALLFNGNVLIFLAVLIFLNRDQNALIRKL